MEARVLGPLEVLVEGTRVEIKGGKQRELLAVLLIHADQIVSADRLIDELWGTSPPPSALKTLQALVSRLRTALGAASTSLETHGQGYRLRVQPGALDANRFVNGLEEGRRALARGDAEAAAELLREALALWRGPALADFRYEDFAQAEISRLEELRLAAQEERIEADLELGRHDELVVELERLVAEHSLRERPRGQLMVALYRSGRQAEALQAFQEGRRALADELGLEPSESLRRLESQILDHDPELAAPARPTRPRLLPTSAWRHPRRVLAVGAVVLATALGAGLYQATRGADVSHGAAGALALDPDTGARLASVDLGSAPSSVSVGEGSVWVVDADDKTVSQIDPTTREVVRTFGTASIPTDVVAGAGAVWVGNAGRGPGLDSILPESLSRLDPETGQEIERIALRAAPGGHQYGVLGGESRNHLVVTHDAVWVINGDLSVSRIDPHTNRVVSVVEGMKAQNIAAGEGRIWVSEDGTVREIDPVSNRVGRRVEVSEGSISAIAVGAGAVWAADPLGGNVWRVQTDREPTKRAVELDTWVAGLSFGEGALWATNEIADRIYRIDPRTLRARVIAGTPAPRGVATGDGAVWVAASSPPSPDAALPAGVCRDLAYEGSGSPDVLLVSDLPLKSPDVRSWTQSLARGFALVLEQRGYEAGPFSVGFQSCDSSTAQAGDSDFFRCGSNAKAYARNLDVVGVFGSFFSPCSYIQIPVANAATGGALAMISPSNTFEDLTEDESLYPSGKRSYFRLATPNRYEGLAHAELARQLGKRRLFLLVSADGEYGPRFPAGLRAYARRTGVDVVGSATFDPDGKAFGALAARVSRSRPSAVSIVGILTPGTGKMVRELRARLGPEVLLVTPDGFQLIDDLLKLAGPGARGLYVTSYGVPNERLSPRGKQFLSQYAAANGGDRGPDFAAAYGAQAAEIMLDAIARSDGTRASVTEELRQTRVRDGILGNVSFDRNGDLEEAPITIHRVAGGRFVVDRVVNVRAAQPRP